MFSEIAVKEAMNKELSQLINKKSFVVVDKKSLSDEQLKQVVATRWVITTRPTLSIDPIRKDGGKCRCPPSKDGG
eukprot:6156018-Amphidinium_carterae.1